MIRVLLVERMNLLRTSLATLLSYADDLLLVGELATMGETATVAHAVRPDVAVIDIEPLADDALVAVTELHESLPECAVLLLADADRPRPLHDPFPVPVHGFVGRHIVPPELVRCIRRVAGGERVIDPELAAALAARRTPLTSREREVLRESASGVPSVEIARRLHLSAGTVRNYLSSILRKTGSRNRLEAVRVATEHGWL